MKQAIQELLDLIMLDDYVQRRAGLDRWARRWVGTAEVTQTEEPGRAAALGPMLEPMRRAAILNKIFEGFSEPDAPPLLHVERVGEATYVGVIHFIREVPLE